MGDLTFTFNELSKILGTIVLLVTFYWRDRRSLEKDRQAEMDGIKKAFEEYKDYADKKVERLEERMNIRISELQSQSATHADIKELADAVRSLGNAIREDFKGVHSRVDSVYEMLSKTTKG